jgi:hypothetical protein
MFAPGASGEMTLAGGRVGSDAPWWRIVGPLRIDPFAVDPLSSVITSPGWALAAAEMDRSGQAADPSPPSWPRTET